MYNIKSCSMTSLKSDPVLKESLVGNGTVSHDVCRWLALGFRGEGGSALPVGCGVRKGPNTGDEYRG